MTTQGDDLTTSGAGVSLGRVAFGGHAGAPPARLSLLGNCQLSVGGSVVALGANAQRLLVLLALRGPQRRTYLAGTLWADTTDDQAAKRLRSTLWRLRRQSTTLLEVDEQSVGLSRSVEVDIDHLKFVCREMMERKVTPDRLTAYFKVLVHTRELLLGFYDEWVLQAREQLVNLRLHALEVLVEDLIAAGRFAESVEAAIAAVQLDPLRESTHRALMRAYLAEGNRASARCEVERYRMLLRSELGIDEQPTSLMLELIPSARPAPAPTALGG
jgi:DNA-binding SARP family transcriptional activator